jgi:hypothetical protein
MKPSVRQLLTIGLPNSLPFSQRTEPDVIGLGNGPSNRVLKFLPDRKFVEI